MRKLLSTAVVLLLALFTTPLLAQDTPAPADPDAIEWQSVIAGQILAFRTHDAVGALHFAGAAFHQTYSDPKQFFLAIIGAGYAPIMESHGQSFGPYKKVADDLVIQDVMITGNDQSVYEAIYQLRKEAEGWRVLGVQLSKTPAVGV
jgi:hypothetical protein